MSSIRRTKKEIRYACGDIAAELLIASHAIKEFDQKTALDIIAEIARLQVDSLGKCSFTFDKAKADFADEKEYRKARHQYTAKAFAKLHENMSAEMQAIVDKMNAAMPQHIKDAIKK